MKVAEAAAQVGSPQGVPCAKRWQVPAAHMPLVRQVEAARTTQVLEGSGAPVATSPQVPRAPGSAQDLHAAVQADAQQTPCAQKVDLHSEPWEQNAPLAFGPHELPSQTLGITQSTSLVQAPKQREPLHAKGAQGSEGGAAHWPVLLQAAAGV